MHLPNITIESTHTTTDQNFTARITNRETLNLLWNVLENFEHFSEDSAFDCDSFNRDYGL
jgi:hypothetical protein